MSVRDVLEATKLTHREYAEMNNVSPSQVSMVATGKRKMPEECDQSRSRIHYRESLEIGEERTDGYYSNFFKTYDGVDIHPSAMKEWALKELRELSTALEETVLARMNPEERQIHVRRVLMEMEDVSEILDATKGIWADKYEIDLRKLNKERREQIRRGER